jgi:hypothetical protein
MNAISKPQPHADAATTALRDAIAAASPALRDGILAYRSATHAMGASSDLLDALRAAGSLVLAAEAISASARHAEATARAALAQTLMDTGACSVRTSSHVFSASPGRQSVTITDAAMVPESMLHQPPPSPDRVRILRLLKAGQSVPGCTLTNGSQPILTVRVIS